LIAKRSTNEEPGIAGLFLLGQALELRIATRMICFHLAALPKTRFANSFAQAQHAGKPYFLRLILLAHQTRPFLKKQSRRDRASKLSAGVTLLF
jgi:hypothetical protein